MSGVRTIALDYRPVVLHPAGIGRYARGLVRGLARQPEETLAVHRFLLFTVFFRHHRREMARAPVPDHPSFRLRGLPFPGKLVRRAGPLARLLLEPFLGGADLFHYTDYLLPPFRKPALVATIHDAAFLRGESWLPPRHRDWMIAWSRRAVATSRLVITVSEASKRDLVELLGADPEGVRVTPLAADPLFFEREDEEKERARREALGVNRPYVLYAGTLEPRKNLERLIRVVARMRNRGRDEILVLAGGRGWLVEETFRALEASGLVVGRDVILPGYVTDLDLRALHRGARVLVYPSLWEGFGLPVLEAMAAGAPVVTSRVSSLPEVAGEAALLVDPESEDEIEAAVGRVLDDAALRARLVEKGRARAGSFTWEETARKTLSVYDEAISPSSCPPRRRSSSPRRPTSGAPPSRRR